MLKTVASAHLPLLPLQAFSDITERLCGKKVWFSAGPGNAGDSLIHAGMRCLFRKIGTEVVEDSIDPDFLVWGGGGNIGTAWPASFKKRQQAFAKAVDRKIPIVVLPQSATNSEEKFPPQVHVFAREKFTRALYPESILAPDLSLAFDDDVNDYSEHVPRFPVGVFLRLDAESNRQINANLSIGDPAKLCRTYLDYFQIISDYAAIATDRLHFAIAAIILKRKSILLPNSYYKNAGVHEAWLSALGCEWGIDAMQALISRHNYNSEIAKR
jgi:exopolysaccharide biosynthesis predicted pyruvyltransferase EpsI